MNYKLLIGDCVATMNTEDLPEESVDHVITDPPYEIGFMGNGWDNTGVAYNPDTWQPPMSRKADGVMLVFGATRTITELLTLLNEPDLKSLMFGLGATERVSRKPQCLQSTPQERLRL